MNEETYRRMLDFLRSHPFLEQAVIWGNRILTGIVYVYYPLLLLFLLMEGDLAKLLRCILVPGVSFVLVSVARKKIGAPRPYEVWNVTPIIAKESKGNSFPSRHAFSVFIIVMTRWYVTQPGGFRFFLLPIGIALAVLRVLGGVHFPADVTAGAVIGILAGFIGYVLI